MTNRSAACLVGVVTLLAATAAQAHPGHIEHLTLASGLMHPLSGLDHLLAMLAVGAYAASQPGRTRWLAPLLFLAGLVLGSLAGQAQLALPNVEAGIAASVLALGLMVAIGGRLPTAPANALITVFALFHGHAHGTEAPTLGQFWHYGMGFIATCIILQATGYALAKTAARHHATWIRAGGALIAACGALMMAQLV